MANLPTWMMEQGQAGMVWCAKRLSGTETLASGSRPVGPCIPPEVAFRVLPTLDRQEKDNPAASLSLRVDSHDAAERTARAIWYNNALRGGAHNEVRITGLGGRTSPLLDPESTGALAIFAFRTDPRNECDCRVWLCRSVLEEDTAELWLGPVEPGRWIARYL